jgi:hypothetical protein
MIYEMASNIFWRKTEYPCRSGVRSFDEYAEEGNAMRSTFFGHAKSIAGPALLGLGILILHEKLDGAAAQVRHVLGIIPGNTPGVLPTVMLAASRGLRAYAADHQRFLRGFLQHVLLSSWPLLLVIIGTVLSRDSRTEPGFIGRGREERSSPTKNL